MHYDKVKDKFAYLIDKAPFLRKIFYLILDLLLLRQWYIKREIRKTFPILENIQLYDAGAGFGQYSWFILKNWKYSNVYAVDLKTDYLDSFSRFIDDSNRFSARQADLVEHLPDKTFDLIIAIDILEHIAADETVLANFRKVLNKKGKLIISSPSNYDKSAEFTAEHVRPGYAKKEIISKLENAGFKIRSFQYSYGKFGHIAWLLTMKFPLSLLEKSKLCFFLLPIYYLLTYPFSALLMLLDLILDNKIGSGIVVVAE